MAEAFDPMELLDLARHLAQGYPTEAGFRSAVSRAYYALFLLARSKTGITTRRGVHILVVEALRRRGGFRSAGAELDALRRLRTVADYDLLPAAVADQNWQRNWRRANHLIERLLRRLEAW